MAKITSGLEDYLESISNNIKINKKVRAIDIAKDLNVSRASVSEALRRLAEQGYIDYGRYGNISITTKGEIAAGSVIKRHNLLHRFLCDILCLSEKEANENACRIEHVISEELLEKLEKFVDFSKKNPEIKNKFQEYTDL